MLALRWNDLTFDSDGVATNFDAEIARPIRALADRTIDSPSALLGLLPLTTVGTWTARAYAKHLYGGATLQELPDRPEFVFVAASFQSGELVRLSKSRIWDGRVGQVEGPDLSLARTVAASAAFPPFLSPLVLRDLAFDRPDGTDLPKVADRGKAILADGGVIDNLALEPVWTTYKTLLISDGTGAPKPRLRPWRNWIGQTYRLLRVMHPQSARVRKWLALSWYHAGTRDGTYWGARSHIDHYGLPTALPAPYQFTKELGDVPTRLASMDERLQERLINWGYAICDAAMRKHVVPDAPATTTFPYPNGVAKP